MASSKCPIDNCKRNSDTFCDHCQGHICTKHYIEHIKAENIKLTFVSDELDSIANSLNEFSMTDFAFEQIEQWREKSHRRIDEIFIEKTQQIKAHIDQKITNQIQELRQLSLQVKELMDEGDASFKQIEQIKRSIDEHRQQCEQLKSFDFFQVNVNAINLEITFLDQKLFIGNGTLLSRDHQIKLNEFYGKQGQIWTLIYKATRDGFSTVDFHRCCANQSPTITIIQSQDNGYLFGGYTSMSWAPLKNYINDPNHPFLFTLTNPHGIPPTKYFNKMSTYAIYTHKSYGPTFGAGHDIYICNNSNINKNSSINFPHSYFDTTNQGSNTFTGNKAFRTRDIEVYQLAQM
ncbi:unnamed protein product [Adineta steineri]|uniref:TLDc domain-containing protein n=1 Tax=Adineta steineri TaxID=433720 RepID=A0A818G785_9BILA|nr:unnamed protein product [Adineta steineri]CAF3484962.1 unnamed protein product [Adineta steineri]